MHLTPSHLPPHLPSTSPLAPTPTSLLHSYPSYVLHTLSSPSTLALPTLTSPTFAPPTLPLAPPTYPLAHLSPSSHTHQTTLLYANNTKTTLKIGMRSQQLHKTCSHCYSHTCAWQSFQSPFAPTAATTPMAPITCKEEVNLAAQCRGLVDTEPRRSVSHHSPMPVYPVQCTHVCSTRYPAVWTPQNLSQAMQSMNPKLHAWRPITCKEEVNLAAKFRKLQLLKS